MPNEFFVAAIDVGTFDNWGLAYKTAPECSISLSGECSHWNLVSMLAEELSAKKRFVALGFEAPLWIPVRSNPKELLKSRAKEEGNRPWSAAAGAIVTTAALAVIPWWLSSIRNELGLVTPHATMDNDYWQPGVLFIWEAFVSGRGKTTNQKNQNDQDANDAVDAFFAKLSYKPTAFESDFKALLSSQDSIFSLMEPLLRLTGWDVLGDKHCQPLVVDAGKYK